MCGCVDIGTGGAYIDTGMNIGTGIRRMRVENKKKRRRATSGRANESSGEPTHTPTPHILLLLPPTPHYPYPLPRIVPYLADAVLEADGLPVLVPIRLALEARGGSELDVPTIAWHSIA